MNVDLKKAIETMDKTLIELKELRKTNPELAKKIAKESLQKTGILDKNGNIAPPYNGQKIHEEDFTMGPGESFEIDEDIR